MDPSASGQHALHNIPDIDQTNEPAPIRSPSRRRACPTCIAKHRKCTPLTDQTQHTDCTGKAAISLQRDPHTRRVDRPARHNHILLDGTRTEAAPAQRDPCPRREARCTRHLHMAQAATGYRLVLAVENDIPALHLRRYDYCSNCAGHRGAPKCAGCGRNMQLALFNGKQRCIICRSRELHTTCTSCPACPCYRCELPDIIRQLPSLHDRLPPQVLASMLWPGLLAAGVLRANKSGSMADKVRGQTEPAKDTNAHKKRTACSTCAAAKRRCSHTKDQAHCGPYLNSGVICAPQAESDCRNLRTSPEI